MAIPEFDGRIISVPVSFKEVVVEDNTIGGVVTKYLPVADRVQLVAGMAVRLARLRHAPNAAKRVAVLFSSYPTKAARASATPWVSTARRRSCICCTPCGRRVTTWA